MIFPFSAIAAISFISKVLPVEGKIFWDEVKVILSDKILKSKNHNKSTNIIAY